MNRHYYIWNMGCQMNKAESERLGGYLEGQGYQAADSPEGAGIIVVNSCVVRRSAEERAVNRLNALKPLKRAQPDTVLALTGCLVNGEIDRLKKSFPHVDYFFKPGECPPWLEGATPAPPRQATPSAFVPIIQGCDNFCSYCIVPYRRGREKSRPLAEVACEVAEMARRGVKEVTLLGQNVDSYGHDLPGGPDLADLLEELNGVDGLARIRFLTNHPKDMSQKLTSAIARLDKVCEQINLPVQAGSDDILKAMRRGYTAQHYRQLVSGIRRQVPGIAISTDVIVGFPAESLSRFQQTLELLAEVKFDAVHVAAYSPRPGTTAARELADDVPAAEKRRRLQQVEKQQEEIAAEINARLLGETVEVLVEGRTKDKWQGRTRSNKPVFFSDGADRLGQLVQIKIEKTSAWSMQGRLAGTE